MSSPLIVEYRFDSGLEVPLPPSPKSQYNELITAGSLFGYE
jgi:hypothetical protein